jgi:3-deoxy-7-phosphoheptulonate synthase
VPGDYAPIVIILDPSAGAGDHETALAVAREAWAPARCTRGDGWAMIALGDQSMAEVDALERLPGVLRAMPITAPFRLASQETLGRSMPVVVSGAGGSVFIGGSAEIITMVRVTGRPEAFADVASAARDAGADVLLAGDIPPGGPPPTDVVDAVCTAGRLGMPACVEVADTSEVAAATRIASIVEVGSRNMQHFQLLRHLGMASTPVLIRRAPGATAEEFLLAAEYVLANGNGRVLLCESGIRMFDESTRTRFDINAVPLVRNATHLPLLADPSSSTAHPSLVPPVARAAVAAGADGVMVAVGATDDDQAIGIGTFARLVTDIRALGATTGRTG